MATGDKYVNVVNKRVLGSQTFRDNLVNYLVNNHHNVIDKVYRRSGTFEQLTLSSSGNDVFTISGYTADFISAMDGEGYFIRPTDMSSYITDVLFENATGNDYHIAIRHAEVPDGLFVNPRDGVPMFDTMREIIGWSGTPDSVVDDGDGTMTFIVNGVTESGVSHDGRKIVVWKNIPGSDAQTETLAVEECTVIWDAGNNKIETAANFGQGSNISTTASDYAVVLMGPRTSRTTDLRTLEPWCFVGIITGNGPSATPVGFDLTNQNTIDIPLSDLSDIVRYENASGTDRLKIDVTVYSGDEGEDQIRVTDPSHGTPIRFRVDGNGNVEIQGDLTVQGDTYQKDITQVNTHNAYFDNLTCGNADSDAHLFKGDLKHNSLAGGYNMLHIDGTNERMGIFGNADPALNLVCHTDLHIDDTFDVKPKTALQSSCGTSGNEWLSVHARDLYVTGTGGGGGGVETDLFPNTAGLYLGDPTARWNGAYFMLNMRLHHDTLQPYFEMGSGTTQDDRKWKWTFSTAMNLYACDQNFSNDVSVLSISRSGTTPSAMALNLDIHPDNAGGHDCGTETYPWDYVTSQHNQLKSDYPTIKIHAGIGTDSYWKIHPYGDFFKITRNNDSWAEQHELLIFAMSGETTCYAGSIAGEIINFKDLIPTTSWTQTYDKSIKVTADQEQRGWIELEIDGMYPSGTHILIPYWHSSDVS